MAKSGRSGRSFIYSMYSYHRVYVMCVCALCRLSVFICTRIESTFSVECRALKYRYFANLFCLSFGDLNFVEQKSFIQNNKRLKAHFDTIKSECFWNQMPYECFLLPMWHGNRWSILCFFFSHIAMVIIDLVVVFCVNTLFFALFLALVDCHNILFK